jgi:hypothetical protein
MLKSKWKYLKVQIAITGIAKILDIEYGVDRYVLEVGK